MRMKPVDCVANFNKENSKFYSINESTAIFELRPGALSHWKRQPEYRVRRDYELRQMISHNI